MRKLIIAITFCSNIISLNISIAQVVTTQDRSYSIATQQAMISVTIGGNFITNGTFSASPNERADQFISRIFNQFVSLITTTDKRTSDLLSLIQEQNQKYARRNIQLKRSNGENITLDLEKFRLTGDFKYNPYLKNEDVIIFPNFDIEKNFVSIYGAVNNPVIFQYVEGDRLSDALIFAQGFSPVYENITTIEISRLSYRGEKEEILRFNIDENPLLKAGDRIRVLADEVRRRDYKVYIAGEVKRPGLIPITKSSTTLKEVIEKAGGVTEKADLLKAELIRGANVFKLPIFTEEMENLLMLRMADISPEDSLVFIVDNKLRFSRGNATINFEEIVNDTTQFHSFIVKNGDYIYIPEKIKLVYVFGQVNNPGYIIYVAGKKIDYYIQQAGGVGGIAKDEYYLIKGKTRSWHKVEEGENIDVEAGDYIWVPKKPIRDFDYYLQRIGLIGGTITGIVSTILLFIQVTK